MRRTFASLLLESGASVPYVMAQLGHRDPTMTLGIYARVLQRSGQEIERLDDLMRSSGLGTNGH